MIIFVHYDASTVCRFLLLFQVDIRRDSYIFSSNFTVANGESNEALRREKFRKNGTVLRCMYHRTIFMHRTCVDIRFFNRILYSISLLSANCHESNATTN